MAVYGVEPGVHQTRPTRGREKARPCFEGTQITRDWKSTLLYPIPSLIYLVHNNVQFMTLKYVDPATYQILGMGGGVYCTCPCIRFIRVDSQRTRAWT